MVLRVMILYVPSPYLQLFNLQTYEGLCWIMVIRVKLMLINTAFPLRPWNRILEEAGLDNGREDREICVDN
jgi:hypothetical protein